MNDWLQRHVSALTNPKPGFERGLLKILEGVNEYCNAHQERYESVIGEDYVLGPPVQDILFAFSTLLNGELGRLDGGSLDTAWRELARVNGLKDQE